MSFGPLVVDWIIIPLPTVFRNKYLNKTLPNKREWHSYSINWTIKASPLFKSTPFHNVYSSHVPNAGYATCPRLCGLYSVYIDYVSRWLLGREVTWLIGFSSRVSDYKCVLLFLSSNSKKCTYSYRHYFASNSLLRDSTTCPYLDEKNTSLLSWQFLESDSLILMTILMMNKHLNVFRYNFYFPHMPFGIITYHDHYHLSIRFS